MKTAKQVAYCVALATALDATAVWAEQPKTAQTPSQREALRQDQVVSALYTCFRRGIDDGGGANTVDFGPASEIFFFEQLAKAMQTLGDTPRLMWCRPWFVDPYLRAQKTFHRAKQVRGHHHPLSLGMPLTSESQVLQLAGREGEGKRTLDHATMTQEALSSDSLGKLLPNMGFSPADQALLVQASQVADQYQYLDLLPHARAPTEPDDGQGAGQQQFISSVQQRMQAAQQALAQGKTGQGLVQLGLAVHAVQDLMLYRGLTLPEQAALAFASGPLAPYGPAVPVNPATWLSAVQATTILLHTALAPFAQSPPTRILAASKNAVLADYVAEVLGENVEPVSFAELSAFWRLGQAQRHTMDNQTQLTGHAPRGQGNWDADAILNLIISTRG